MGLEVLVIDYDDLMKRIRDYSKDKLILPGFGGGDRQRFPAGGELIEKLRFPAIDKDDLCHAYKDIYGSFEVPARVGVELLTLAEQKDGVYVAGVFDHGARREEVLRARKVVLAIGRGVPRRFDIPGNTDDVCYRLAEAADFVGAPACVIGGGTSAAEAVIAISGAKAGAGDPTPVCWSYRGDRMPRVSKALAEEFFEAYIGNGNIRYYPKSEPVGVLVAEDRSEVLAIRIDRRSIEGRPTETVHLEFPKARCIACIGEDLPESLLAALGIPMVPWGERQRPRILVDRGFESVRPGLYVIGDLLSPAYLEVDGPAGSGSPRLVKRRGNIKSALRDGVLVAQVIAQRLAGATTIDFAVADAEPDAAAPAGSWPSTPVGEGPDEVEERSVLVRIFPGGVGAEEFELRRNGVTTIGRAAGDLVFPQDTTLSTPHASIAHSDEGYRLRDDGAETGVFLRLVPGGQQEVRDRDLVRVGRQFLVFQIGAEGVGFEHFDARGQRIGQHSLDAHSPRSLVVGRRARDLTLDAEDRTLSRRHLAISSERGRVWVKDLKSANGSFLRVRGAVRLEPGQQFRIGQQTFTLSGAEPESPTLKAVATEPAPAVTERAVSPAAGALTVTFQPLGRTVNVAHGQTLCDAAEAAGIELAAECHAGICGSDPLRVIAGHENLETLSEQEAETLEAICELEPGACRLACMARIRGPVEVEILTS